MPITDYLPWMRGPAPKFVSEAGAPVYGVVAEFDSVGAVVHAAHAVRDAGFKKWDVLSPFPIHGIDEAMGVKPTILPVLVACGAAAGVATALGMQWFMNYSDYFLLVQGKPDNAWEPFTPVTFELGVLFSSFTALFGMLALNGLPRWNHPIFRKDRLLAVSDDRFAIVVESADDRFDPERVRDLLRKAGGTHIDLVTE